MPGDDGTLASVNLQPRTTDTQLLHLLKCILDDPELFMDHLEAVLPISNT